MYNNTPLYNRLVQHNGLDRSSFHTPGHKCADFFPDDLLKLDYTELPDTDALFEADGVILETEKNLAELFGTKRSMISSGGCTLAIQAMLRLALLYGNKMLFARNVHRSAVNTMALLGIEPVWLAPKSENGLFTGRVTPQDIEQALKNDSEISACYLTSPDYYGEISDIEAIAKICKKYNTILLVDNAHGSHLAFMNENLHPVHLGADMSACSMHKTMPVLTGGAVLNIGNSHFTDNAKDAMALFGSTSPSYPIMSSIDICTDYMLNRGGINDYRQLETRISKIKQLAAQKGIIQPDGLCDPLRVCLNTASVGLVGKAQQQYFEDNGIDCEFCDGENAVFICTPFNSERDFIRLENAIENMPVSKNLSTVFSVSELPKKALSPREAMFSKVETVSLENSLGRIAADTACPCPPGIPVVMPGEIIDHTVIELLKNYGFTKIKCVK